MGKELRMMARTRVYLVVTAVGPLVIVALLAVSVLVERLIDSSLEGRTLAVVAAGGACQDRQERTTDDAAPVFWPASVGLV